MAKQLTAQEQADKTLAELREAIRDAHGLLKDMKHVSQLNADLLAKARAFTQEEIAGPVGRRIEQETTMQMTAAMEMLNTVIEEARDIIYSRFDKFIAGLLGEDTEGMSVEEMLIRFAEKQQIIAAQGLKAGGMGVPEQEAYDALAGDYPSFRKVAEQARKRGKT